MKVLVVGSGGREHALAWQLSRSPKISRVFVAPGNGGTALAEDLTNLPITDIYQLMEWAKANTINLTVVGPEAPLAAGIVDLFRANDLRIFGPSRAAAQLESSKAFSKDFMKRHGIPTAAYEVFTDAVAAHTFVDKLGVPIVIKADGLAAGKGVVVATTLDEAHSAVDDMLAINASGIVPKEDGARIVIEEFLEGEEASFIVVTDGKGVCALATSQDHKRIFSGDRGPNTGGMGAYSPAPVVTPDVHARVMREIILPTIKGMALDGITYTGFLYAGLMIDAQGKIKTLEFNVRMGDPETQPIMMRLKSDLFDLLMAATDNTEQSSLDGLSLEWFRQTAIGVVLAASGYPANPRKGDAISKLPADREDMRIFHAGTVLEDGVLKTSGGRVLCVTVLADSLRAARQVAYSTIANIDFPEKQFRDDIGHHALKRNE